MTKKEMLEIMNTKKRDFKYVSRVNNFKNIRTEKIFSKKSGRISSMCISLEKNAKNNWGWLPAVIFNFSEGSNKVTEMEYDKNLKKIYKTTFKDGKIVYKRTY